MTTQTTTPTHTNRLKLVYNNNQIIMDAGFTMQSNYALPVLSRMVDEGLINYSAQTVVQTILSYKHTEDNPFPSREEIASRLGKSLSYVKKALKSISDSGILIFEKAGRRNTYNFKPFFSLIEKFIVEFKVNKKKDIKVKELMAFVSVEKKDNDFTWTEDTKKATNEATKEEVKDVFSLPDNIMTMLKANKVCKSGIESVSIKYEAYSHRLSDLLFMQKITASANKKDFVAFFNVCIDNAFSHNEQPTEAPQPAKRVNRDNNAENKPEWFDSRNDPKPKPIPYAEKVMNFTKEELLSEKEKHDRRLSEAVFANNVSMLVMQSQVNARLNNPNVTLDELLTHDAREQSVKTM